jgi:hypothetical protein
MTGVIARCETHPPSRQQSTPRQAEDCSAKAHQTSGLWCALVNPQYSVSETDAVSSPPRLQHRDRAR